MNPDGLSLRLGVRANAQDTCQHAPVRLVPENDEADHIDAKTDAGDDDQIDSVLGQTRRRLDDAVDSLQNDRETLRAPSRPGRRKEHTHRHRDRSQVRQATVSEYHSHEEDGVDKTGNGLHARPAI